MSTSFGGFSSEEDLKSDKDLARIDSSNRLLRPTSVSIARRELSLLERDLKEQSPSPIVREDSSKLLSDLSDRFEVMKAKQDMLGARRKGDADAEAGLESTKAENGKGGSVLSFLASAVRSVSRLAGGKSRPKPEPQAQQAASNDPAPLRQKSPRGVSRALSTEYSSAGIDDLKDARTLPIDRTVFVRTESVSTISSANSHHVPSLRDLKNGVRRVSTAKATCRPLVDESTSSVSSAICSAPTRDPFGSGSSALRMAKVNLSPAPKTVEYRTLDSARAPLGRSSSITSASSTASLGQPVPSLRDLKGGFCRSSAHAASTGAGKEDNNESGSPLKQTTPIAPSRTPFGKTTSFRETPKSRPASTHIPATIPKPSPAPERQNSVYGETTDVPRSASPAEESVFSVQDMMLNFSSEGHTGPVEAWNTDAHVDENEDDEIESGKGCEEAGEDAYAAEGACSSIGEVEYRSLSSVMRLDRGDSFKSASSINSAASRPVMNLRDFARKLGGNMAAPSMQRESSCTSASSEADQIV